MIIAVILAAGKGARLKQADKPKQYLEISGKAILEYTVEKFLACHKIDQIVIAVQHEWMEYVTDLFSEQKYARVAICEGAGSRQESLFQALQYCHKVLRVPDDTLILSHDAARPFVTQEIIEANIHAMENAQAVTTAIPVTDTIIQSADGMMVSELTDRSAMFQVQTPQSFYLKQYIDIYKLANKKTLGRMTDAAGLLHCYSVPVGLVQGNRQNIKITTDDDLDIAEYLIKKTKT